MKLKYAYGFLCAGLISAGSANAQSISDFRAVTECSGYKVAHIEFYWDYTGGTSAILQIQSGSTWQTVYQGSDLDYQNQFINAGETQYFRLQACNGASCGAFSYKTVSLGVQCNGLLR